MNLRALAVWSLALLAAGCSSSPKLATSDTTPPTIAVTSPPDSDFGGTGSHLSINFSESMDTATVTVAVTDGTSAYDPGAPTWSNDNTIATFASPPHPFEVGKSYAVTVNGQDAYANVMAETSFSFSVIQAVLAAVAPAPGATEVSPKASILLTFNRAVDRATVESALSVTSGGTPVSCLLSWSSDSKVVQCAPNGALAISTTFTVSLASTARSATGDAIDTAGLLPATFTTAAADLPPTVTRDATGDVAAGNVVPGARITLVFSEPVNQATAQAAFSLKANSALVGGSFDWDLAKTRMTFQPSAPLPYGASCEWTVVAGVPDLGGQTMASTATGSFHVVQQATEAVALVSQASGTAADSLVVVDSSATVVGDSVTDITAGTYYTFDLSGLTQAATAIAIDGATLAISMHSIVGDPAGLGTLWAQSVNYGASLSAEAETRPTDSSRSFLPCTRPGVRTLNAIGPSITPITPISPVIPIDPVRPGLYTCPYQVAIAAFTMADVDATRTIDVSSIVAHQWWDRTNRGDRAQFRLAFATATDGDKVLDVYQLNGPAATSVSLRPKLAVTYQYAW